MGVLQSWVPYSNRGGYSFVKVATWTVINEGINSNENLKQILSSSTPLPYDNITSGLYLPPTTFLTVTTDLEDVCNVLRVTCYWRGKFCDIEFYSINTGLKILLLSVRPLLYFGVASGWTFRYRDTFVLDVVDKKWFDSIIVLWKVISESILWIRRSTVQFIEGRKTDLTPIIKTKVTNKQTDEYGS